MIFSVENGSFAYKAGSRQVLKNVSFQAGPGELLAILGPNGAGKTTLLRCAMGFLKWSEGKSSLNGRDINAIPHRELWSSIAYVPQARGVVSPYTAEEMILLGRSSRFGIFSQPTGPDFALAESLMDRLGILSLKTRRCSELSGGELQMVLIARALAAEPQVLILDEPESNLDFKNQLMVMETMSALAASGMTCIFNTHYPAHAMQRATKALLLEKNGSSQFGGVNEIITESNLKRAFGVTAVISEIETPVSVVRDVVPVMMTDDGDMTQAGDANLRRLATISVIMEKPGADTLINGLFHEYNRYIVGRMGMPYPAGGVNIINVNMDGPEQAVRELTQRLSVIPGVSVKATFARSYITKGGEPNDQH